jgi:membrane protein YdbS with pleckstrin-like domain
VLQYPGMVSPRNRPDPDDGRARGLWGWQNEVWALLFAVVAFERLYRLAVTPLEWSLGDVLLVATTIAAVALTALFAWRWRRERRRPDGASPQTPAE